MKKICIFTNSMFKIGGEQRVTSILVNNLIEKGYDVTIIIKCAEKVNYKLFDLSKKINLIFLNYNYDFRLNNKKVYEKLRTINRRTGLFKNNTKIIRQFFCSNKMIRDLKKFFLNNKFDIVIGIAGDRSFILSYIKKYLNSKLIFWNHSEFNVHFKNIGSRYYNEEKFIKPLFKNFDEVVVLTKSDKELFDKNYSINSTTIYNPISFNSSQKTDLNNHKFLAIGRLCYQKGFEYLIEAMELFLLKNKNWSLNIYGSGSFKKKLNDLIENKGLSKQIKIYGEVADIRKVYLKHDIYLMSSRFEGFGLVTVEALECGLPVIAFDIRANKEIIKHNKNGILIKQFDIKKYSEAMLELVSNKEKLLKMQKDTYLSLNKFTNDKFIKNWLKIL